MIFKLKERKLPIGLSPEELIALHLAVYLEVHRYKDVLVDYWTSDVAILRSAQDKLWGWLFGEETQPLVHLEWKMSAAAGRLEFGRFKDWKREEWPTGGEILYCAILKAEDVYNGKVKA